MTGINTNPTFGRTPLLAAVRIATANTNRDGTGTLGDLYAEPTAANGGDGAIFDRVSISATAATTAGMIRFFDYDGTNNRFLIERLVSAIVTPSATVKSFNDEVNRSDGLPAFTVMPGHTLRVSTHIAESFDIVGQGRRY